MAFPTTGLLDNFNRADETPIAGNWSLMETGLLKGNLSGNQLIHNDSNYNFTYWNATQFAADQEVWATVVGSSVNHMGLALGVKNPGAAPDCYYLAYFPGTPTVSLYKRTANSFVLVQASLGTFADGDKLGLSRIGTSLQAYRFTGGAWATLGAAVTNSDITGAGYIGLMTDSGNTTYTFDDFGGGNVGGGSLFTGKFGGKFVGKLS